MQEQLEGRLKWERREDGIQVSIPVRRGPSTLGYALLILIWLTIASVHYWHLLSGGHTETQEYTLEMIAVGLYVFGFFIFIGWLAWTATGESVLILDSDELKIQTRAIGIELTSKTYRTTDVRNIRWVRPKQFWALRSDTDPSTSKIQFVTATGFHTFGKGIAESEARALIERMGEVYRFPRSGETYYGAVAR